MNERQQPTLDELRARINALPVAHFQPLLDLLPAFRAPLPPITEPLTEQADGSYLFNVVYVQPVHDLIALCYELELVMPFDWGEFKKEVPFYQQPELIDGFDRFQCCQAITTIVRGDRFVDGLVDTAWRNGTLARIVERLAVVV